MHGDHSANDSALPPERRATRTTTPPRKRARRLRACRVGEAPVGCLCWDGAAAARDSHVCPLAAVSAVCPEHTRAARRKCNEQRHPKAGSGQELGDTAVQRRRRARGVGDAGRRGRTSLRAHALQGRGGRRTRSQCRSLTAARGCQHSGGDRAGWRGGTGGAWQAHMTRGRCAVDVGGGSGSRAAAHLKCCICDQDGRHLSSGGGPRWFDGQTRGTWRGTGPRRGAHG